jgi:MYXO-CTERM domain-containing protein
VASATLTLDASATATLSGAGLNLSGAVTNEGTSDAALNFSASSGTITLASLSGAGKTRFGRDAVITGGVSSGVVTVVGALNANISGGTVTAAAHTGSISGGTTTISGVATIATLSGGTVNLNGATSSVGTLTAGTINLGATALTVDAGTFTGLLAGAQGSLIKASAGTLTLSGANTFGGGTTVSAGTLIIGQAGSLGSGAVTVASGASLDLANFSVSNVITAATGASIINGPSTASVTTTGSQSVNTVLTGDGGLTKSDGGELTLTTPNFFTGGVSATTAGAVISAAHLADGASSLGASALNDPTKLVLGNGATLEFTGTTATTTSRSFTVAGEASLAVDANAAALTFSAASIMALDAADPTPQLRLVANNSGVNRFEAQLSADDIAAGRGLSSLVIDGTGKWVLGGSANRFKGDVRVDVGGGATLGFEAGALGTGAGYSSSVIEVGNGSKLAWSGSNTDDISSRLSVPAGATAKLDLGSNNVTFASAPTVGSGASLEKQGTGTLKIAATVSAPTLNVAVSGGRLAVNGTLGNITLGSGATLGGSGTIGTATVAAGATVAPGNSPGLLTGASLSYSGGANFEWEVQDATSLSGYDRISLSGNLDLTGASPGNRINLKIISRLGNGDGNTLGNPLNFAPPGGAASIRTFQFGQVGGVLLNSGQNISDVFAFDLSQFTYSDGSSSNAALWSIDWNSGTGAITLTAVPEPSTYGIGLGALALAAAALRRRRRTAPQA